MTTGGVNDVPLGVPAPQPQRQLLHGTQPTSRPNLPEICSARTRWVSFSRVSEIAPITTDPERHLCAQAVAFHAGIRCRGTSFTLRFLNLMCAISCRSNILVQLSPAAATSLTASTIPLARVPTFLHALLVCKANPGAAFPAHRFQASWQVASGQTSA